MEALWSQLRSKYPGLPAQLKPFQVNNEEKLLNHNFLAMLLHLRSMHCNWLGQVQVWYSEYLLDRGKHCPSLLLALGLERLAS